MPADLLLEDAVRDATEASPEHRIEFRDAIAKHGDDAVDRVAAWLADPRMAAFAIRVIVRAAEFGSETRARSALQSGLATLDEPALSDARAALLKMGGARPPRRSRDKPVDAARAVGLDELAIGTVYLRRELHLQGLGGNRQKGISYPANGSYVLLFSDPNSVDEWGYRDGPDGPDGYLYYGEWNGTGDMLLSGGNAAILDRSPQIYLFVRTPPGHRYLGRFLCLSTEQRPATRDGREYQAIVFHLRRISAEGQR
jgi:hypothetical protein